jgi:DNA-binding LacI/PurR family transcriptional regulator
VSRERKRGYLEAMNEAGLPVDERLVVASPFSEEGGATAYRMLPEEYTAIFARTT